MDVRIDVENKTIWMSQDELSTLYEKSIRSIIRYLVIAKSQYGTNVSPVDDKMSLVAQKMSLVQLEGDREVEREIDCYNLEIIMLIGERIKSNRGILLKEFLDNYLYGDTSNIIIYNNGNLKLDVKVSPEEETVWLTEEGISRLFEKDRSTINKHINNIYEEGELFENRTCAKNAQVQLEGDRKITRIICYYNLDMILAIGYRVSGTRAIEFRKWASSVLKQYLLKGYVLDSDRVIVSRDNFIRLENDITEIKGEIEGIKQKVFVEPIKERILFDGEYFDSRELICSLLSKAEKSVIVIDPYFDIKGLSFLSKINSDIVEVVVVLSTNAKLKYEDVEAFEKQFFKLNVVKDDTFHDRFIILDFKDCYILGTSFNYIGNKVSFIHKIGDQEQVERLILKIHKPIEE